MNYYSLTIIRSLLAMLMISLHQLERAQACGFLANGTEGGAINGYDDNEPDQQQYEMNLSMNCEPENSNQANEPESRQEQVAIPTGPFSINTDVLARLADDVSIEIMPDLIEAFLEELDTRLAVIQNTPLSSNEKSIRTQVHSIKSCARTFGATELANKAAHIEQMIDAKVSNTEWEIQQMLALLPSIHQAFNLYLAKLAQSQ